MTTNLRIYPLRLTKRKWKIPIYVRHNCSEYCGSIFVKDTDNPYQYYLISNPDYHDGKCSQYEKVEKGSIHMSTFDPGDPRGAIGPLYNPDEVVIPDQKIHINIDYPLVNPVNVTIDFGHPRVTRREVLFIISTLYRQIYDEEERTSPPIEYLVTSQCEGCLDKKISDYIITYKPTKKQECSICFQNYKKKKGAKLPCGHIFHEECISMWLDPEEDKNSCPLCRKSVLDCNDCDGKRIKQERHESVVIPLEHRGHLLNRNRTNGVFGIYGHDLEDLGIENMEYDRINKKLYLGIYS